MKRSDLIFGASERLRESIFRDQDRQTVEWLANRGTVSILPQPQPYMTLSEVDEVIEELKRLGPPKPLIESITCHWLNRLQMRLAVRGLDIPVTPSDWCENGKALGRMSDGGFCIITVPKAIAPPASFWIPPPDPTTGATP